MLPKLLKIPKNYVNSCTFLAHDKQTIGMPACDAAAHSTTIAFAQYDDFMIYESYYDSK